MKTREELNALKEEVETVRRKLRELTEEELEQVVGGSGGDDRVFNFDDPDTEYELNIYKNKPGTFDKPNW